MLAAETDAQSVSGTVLNGRGAAIVNAEVNILKGRQVESVTTTDSDGNFSLPLNGKENRLLLVTADGFASFSQIVNERTISPLNIVLQPFLTTDVTVSITRGETRVSETPASVVVLTRDDLESTAAQSIDDSLRQVAGFTLFRRSGSRTTNPTAQGANLRGVSGSGASRAAVLFDGLSLNDAFGGWTYWSRVPMIAVEQAEVLRGGASSLYGSGGLSGAVNIVPQRPGDDGPILNLRASTGTQNTYDGSVYTAYAKRGWAVDLAAETFQTGGYIPVAKNERGIADTRANSRHNNGTFGIERKFSTQRRGDAEKNLNGRVFVRGNIFDERRDNGTSLTYNKTYFRQAAGGADVSHQRTGEFRFRAFIESQVYDQTFSAVAADRNSETLSRLQRVPSQAAGASLFWTKLVNSHTLSASFETREVRGFSDEVGYFGGRATSVSGSGGSERTNAFFVQDAWAVTTKLSLNLGARIDVWKNVDAHSKTRSLTTGASSDTLFPDRSEAAFSPRVAAIYQINQNTSVYGAFTRSFRAPTLNELYRGFRVGNIVTQPNENLRAENANTFEGGVNVMAIAGRLNIRGNVFATNVSDPVVSITLNTTPSLITRRRQNLGETRTRGLELDAEYAIRRDLRFSASYLFADSRVTEFSANPALIGNFLPQIPRQQLTFQLNYRPPTRFSFGIQSRISDAQWEDDQNTFRLRPYFTMDATAAYRVHRRIELFAAAENIFNSRYDIGLTPVRTVAVPAFIRVGIRVEFGND
ncbi:MAG: TonB-dependent receptor [Acidobacteria bacterium]|nr:TonB-dependent receptor [Acidobacteriota bacterium]